MLNLSAAYKMQIQEHAKAGYPSEVVGILAGKVSENRVEKVVSLVNERSDTHNRYQVSALVLYRATQKLEDEGYDILGYYHSHPDHPSQYSDYDREHALPNLSYVIVSVQKGEPQQMQSWRLSEDRSEMIEESIIE